MLKSRERYRRLGVEKEGRIIGRDREEARESAREELLRAF